MTIVGSLHDGSCKSADECVCNPLYIAKPIVNPCKPYHDWEYRNYQDVDDIVWERRTCKRCGKTVDEQDEMERARRRRARKKADS